MPGKSMNFKYKKTFHRKVIQITEIETQQLQFI